MVERTKNAAPPPVANGHDKAEDITIDDAATVETEVETDAAPAAATAKDPGVASLEEQLATERRRREAAEAEASRLTAERGKDQKVLTDSRLLVIDSTITTNEEKKKGILQRIKEAKEAGDYDAEVNATAELADVTLDLKQAKLGKDRLEQQIEEAKNAPTTPADPLEAWFEANNTHPKSREWIRGHKDYVEDPIKNADLTKAHHMALRDGHAMNSPGYFAAIEKQLGLDGSVVEEAAPAPTPERRTAAPAAPVTRRADLGGGQQSAVEGITILGNGKYRVTPAIAEAAAIAGIPVSDYVKEALKLTRGSDGQLH